MKLEELIKSVKEQHLDKTQLEDYHSQLSSMFAQMMLEMADLERSEALFMDKDYGDESVAQIKIWWKASDKGQRLIVLKRYQLAIRELLNSLKSRIYTFL